MVGPFLGWGPVWSGYNGSCCKLFSLGILQASWEQNSFETVSFSQVEDEVDDISKQEFEKFEQALEEKKPGNP